MVAPAWRAPTELDADHEPELYLAAEPKEAAA